jgi:hypothetical protein
LLQENCRLFASPTTNSRSMLLSQRRAPRGSKFCAMSCGSKVGEAPCENRAFQISARRK